MLKTQPKPNFSEKTITLKLVRKLYTILIVMLLHVVNLVDSLSAQAAFSYDVVLSDIEAQIRKGNRRALRDLGSLLDKPSYQQNAVLLLEHYTFFTTSEIDLTHASREQFMAFFFKNEEKIKFSEILRAFYLTPVEYQSYDFKMKFVADSLEDDPSVSLRRWVSEFDHAWRSEQPTEKLLDLVKKIGMLNTRQSNRWLRNTLQNVPFNRNQKALYLALCEGLKHDPSEDNLKTILNTAEKGVLSAELLSPTLLELTNFAISPIQTQRLLDSLETLEAVRSYGYDQVLPFRDMYFYDKVDYYGKIMSRKDTPWVQRNALRDVLKTEHPRLLFYLATHIRHAKEEREDFEKILQKLTKTQFFLPNTEGVFSGKLSFERALESIEKMKNFVVFWANHAEEFEWDAERHFFANKNILVERGNRYERLFRRLSSENDTAAMASFTELTEGDPAMIGQLAEKYRPLLRAYNAQLPDFRYGYLEQMSRLVTFCKKNKIAYRLPTALDTLMLKLQENMMPDTRYLIENQIISESKLEDITALEFYGCLYSSNPNVSFSVGRILDFVYSKYWTTILNNDEPLRLFLKKCFVFKKIGVVGVCNSYQNKISFLNPVLRQHLTDIARTESDDEVLSQINILLGDNKTDVSTQSSMLDVFLNETIAFASSDLRLLPSPQEADYQRITQKLLIETDREVLRIVLDYLELHPSLAAVPHLFTVITDDRVIKNSNPMAQNAPNTEGVRVSDRVVSLLQNIYNHVFKVEDERSVWRRMWHKEGKNYRNWDKIFFDEQLRYISNADKIAIEDLNEISNSGLAAPKHKPLILNALKHIKPFSDVRRLRSRLPLRVSQDLEFFDSLTIDARDLDEFVNLFEVDNDSTMWRFVNKKTYNYSLDELGVFYNSLFKINWFINSVGNERIGKYQRNLAIEILQNYLSNSEILTEFEEQNTLLHIAELQNVGRTLAEKLEASIKLDIGDDAKANIQSAILARVGYADIGTVARYFDRLSSSKNYQPWQFLCTDFGVPIFNPDQQTLTQLADNHRNMSPLNFYKFYLKRFGVDFMKNNDELDYQKIYNILKYEIVAPFTGGGTQRDYFTYGIIKVLELTFNTRLAFHEKLNESQTFYTFTAAKRAAKWMQYLEYHRLVNPDPSVPASFNRLFAGN